MQTVTIHEAKTTLSKLIAKVEAGAEIVVCRGPMPIAKLVRYHAEQPRRPKVGDLTSEPVKINPGCFAPLSAKEMKEWGLA
jgi:antitoxin (DNA-binding transcriptional repressor) of toxin-antitoxin stability system